MTLDPNYSNGCISLSCSFALQALYAYTNNEAAAGSAAGGATAASNVMGTVAELHVDGFDAEQIWLQLDSASAQLVRRARRLLKKAGTDPSLLTPERDQDLTGQPSILQVSGFAFSQACKCSALHVSRRNHGQTDLVVPLH